MGALSPAEYREYLDLLEAERRHHARSDLDAYCRYIEIPGAPMVEDTCPLGDACDDRTCTGHEVSGAFYADTVAPATHHSLLNGLLQQLASREIPRLLVFMPPGSAKSSYGSVTFPTWYMGKKPGTNIISTSYATALARKFGRRCRAITGSQRYSALFGTFLNADNRSTDDWSLTSGSTYMGAGILAGITGNRADGLVIDDPIKGREQADSEVIRDKIWDAYLTDLRTRLKPGAWQLIIQTRWHEDDLAGRILPKGWAGESGWITSKQGEPWYVLCLQAQCERDDDPLGRAIGDWLWTDWFTPAHWAMEKRVQGSRNWSALYQQCPAPSEGSLIKRAWPQRYTQAPAEFLRIVQSWDTAYKDEEINDPSVCTTWGETRLYWMLLHVFRDRMAYPALKRAVASLAQQWNPHAILIEDKASGQSLIQEMRNHFALPVIAIEPEGSKLNRLIAVSSLYEGGLVHHPQAAPWLMDYETELHGYPLVAHDDQVDSSSQALRWMHSHRGSFEHQGSGQTRAGFEAHDQQPTERDEGYGSIGGDNDMEGFF